jgi:hypothetical protein
MEKIFIIWKNIFWKNKNCVTFKWFKTWFYRIRLKNIWRKRKKHLWIFSKLCKHFKDNPTDFQLFTKLVFQFEPLIDKVEIKELFDYLGEKTIDI